MEFFIDTASASEIRSILPWGIISGVTTNQKLFLAEKGTNYEQRLGEILSLVNGPVSVELTENAGTDDDLINEAVGYSRLNPSKIVVKVPMFGDGRGLRIVTALRKRNIRTNMTALMSTSQVILAAKAGVTYASIFFNRVKDAGEDPNAVIRDSRSQLDRMKSKTRIIVGSIRKPEDVIEAIIAGADIMTVPYKILAQLPYHSKTEETIKEFDQAWAEFSKSSPK